MTAPISIVAAGAVVAAIASASQPLSPVEFQQKPGWHVGAGRVHSCPGVARSRCTQVGSWAATVRWRDCQFCAPPHRTLASLPAGGVVIQLLLASTRELPRDTLHWPPRLRARRIVSPVEGAPARVGYFGRAGRLRGLAAQLFVYFGRRHPTQRQLARAQAQLRSARLP